MSLRSSHKKSIDCISGSSSHAPSTHSDRRGNITKHENTSRKAAGDLGQWFGVGSRFEEIIFWCEIAQNYEVTYRSGASRIPADQLAPEVDAQLEQLSNLPKSIKNILVNEHDAVVNHGRLANLPARVTVYDFVEKYVEFTKSRYGDKAIEIE